MVSFDPDNNCVEAFDVSGHVDVFIDGALYSTCKFTKAVKVHLVLDSLKDTGTSSSIDKKEINCTASSDQLLTDESKRHSRTEYLDSVFDQNQVGSFSTTFTDVNTSTVQDIWPPSLDVPPQDTNNAGRRCVDSHVSEVIDRPQVSDSVSDGVCKDTNSVLESSVESGNEDKSSQSNIASETEKNSGRKSRKPAALTLKRPHEAISGSNEYSCSACGKHFDNKEQMLDHRRNPLCEVDCSKCQEKFPSKVNYFSLQRAILCLLCL